LIDNYPSPANFFLDLAPLTKHTESQKRGERDVKKILLIVAFFLIITDLAFSKDLILRTDDLGNTIVVKYNKKSSHVVIPEDTTVIEEKAFYGHDVLKRIFIPASVTEIGDGAFYFCLELEEIVVSKDNPNYSSRDGVLFDKQGKTLIAYPGRQELSSLLNSRRSDFN
jgi:hypothetical protein